MSDDGSAALLRANIMRDRGRIARGERPTYRVAWATSVEGSIDVRIIELPIVHLFVPEARAVLDGARVLIARTLDVDPNAFDVELAARP